MLDNEFKLTNRIIFILSLFGLLVSLYLLYTYVAKLPIVCVNTGCETVRESPYSYVFGVPLPAFGALFYVGIFLLSFARTIITEAKHHEISTKTIFALALSGLGVSAYLTYLETFKIKAYCIWCLVSALIVSLIFIASAFEIRKGK